MNRLFITGDTHGNFDAIVEWTTTMNTTYQDALIIAGDNGIRFYGAKKTREENLKTMLSKLPITIFAVRGNHDRPYKEGGDLVLEHCRLLDECSPLMWHDPKYPNIWYFQDGCCYTIGGKTFLTIGGAYSVDKYFRLFNHFTWFENEQLSNEEKGFIFDRIKGKHYDYVITHTCPYTWMPTDLFMNNVLGEVDNSTELWLENVKDSITYDKWYFGHFHKDRDDIAPNADMLFDGIKEISFGEQLNTQALTIL